MSLIITVLILWGLCKLVSAAYHHASQRRMERIEAEQAAQREEQRRMIMRQREQANRLAKAEQEQSRQRKEQQKQAEQIAKLKYTVAQTISDIAYLTDHIADLDAQLDYCLLQQAETIPGSKSFEKYQNKVVSLKTRIHAAESKLSKAQYQQAQAKRKLA